MPERRRSIVPAPGVRPDGSMGVRGWRGLCGRCLWLGPVGSYYRARHTLTRHRETCK